MISRNGFSLVELLAGLCIVAIGMTLATASYQAQVRRVRRLDAHQGLFDLQSRQQRFRFDHGRFAVSLAELAGAPGPWHSPAGYYVVALQAADGATWIATATATSDGGQRSDEACRVISLDHTGQRGASGAPDASVRCWR